LDEIPARVADKSRILLMNYPNNPTGAVLPDMSLFERAIHFAKRRNCLIAHDNAYSEITFDGYKAPSFLQLPQAKKLGIEFHSFSKTYSMAGWRVAFAVGNAEVLANLSKFKSFLDYGIPGFIQEAAAEALNGPQTYVQRIRRVYMERRDVLVRSLNDAGWPVRAPLGSMYLWARIPKLFYKAGSFAFAERLLLREGVVVAPGIGFGPCGEGYVRFALVTEVDRLREAARRIERFLRSEVPVSGKPLKKAHRTVLLTEH
jgi:aspartate/methionine/tyrosine aminotransferase